MAFKRLLVANRGEIAVRINRAARELGVEAIAIYSDDDAEALHVQTASQARALHGAGPAAYLDAKQIVALAREAGADAIHPGYGFLSESLAFAQQCAEAGIKFIGPRVDQLLTFGDKVKARQAAEQCDIPCIEGTRKATSLDEAKAFYQRLQTTAEAQGQPAALMIKAVSGGGGRGMRSVKHADELDAAYQRCQSEARTAFGSDEVYVERLIQQPRHVEVQILGDGCGGVVHLHERECSIQRRHQKVIEVAPSPSLTPALRKKLFAAAVKLGSACEYEGLGTVEFLLDGSTKTMDENTAFYFIEVNPRIQVEHTVTEEILRLDLVKTQLLIAAGQSLSDLTMTQADIGQPRGYALQLRINMETLLADGSTRPATGTLNAFDLPAGPGIRVDSAGYSGYTPSPLFDSLLAKVVVYSPSAQYSDVVKRAYQALCEINISGVATNTAFLQNLLSHPAFKANAISTEFIDQHLAELTSRDSIHQQLFVHRPQSSLNEVVPQSPLQPPALPVGQLAVTAPLQGLVIELAVAQGDSVRKGQPLAVLEAMKMEHVIDAPCSGRVHSLSIAKDAVVSLKQCLLVLCDTQDSDDSVAQLATVDPAYIRPDLAEVLARQAQTQDAARPEAVAKRHQQGQRTARENIADLVDTDSFMEYGSLAVAAQRGHRDMDDLIQNTPADGLITGVAQINGQHFTAAAARCLVMAYDSTVHAGTQGLLGHKKKDRMLALAREQQLPVVLFAEGGGGRPGDTDITLVVETPSFLKYAQLSGRVPLVGITTRYCFAGNAALLGCSDVIIATRHACIGMAGPAMVEGGGLGSYAPGDIGPMSVQAANGVVDIVVDDEAAAVAAAKRYLSYFQGAIDHWDCGDQRQLRHIIPEARSQTYDIRALIETLADTGSVLELRKDFGLGVITALVRLEGKPFGIIANNNAHMGGAIESPAAEKAARFMRLCNAFDLPLVNLMDTPGFMVGPEAEKTAQVRRFARLFVGAAACQVPVFTVVLRKGYGLGALGMTAGSFHSAVFSVAWPSGEFGGMNPEGLVRLGYGKELAAIADPDARSLREDQLLAQFYADGKAINMASHIEIDNVIDPTETRRWLLQGLQASRPPAARQATEHRFIDTW